MFYEFIKLVAYEVCDLLPLGAQAHSELVTYYFNYPTVSYEQKVVCLFAIGVSVSIYFISDIYKMIKELIFSTWLILIGRGTVHQVCTEFKHLNMLLLVVLIGATSYPAFILGDRLGTNYYLIGSMLILSAVALRASETFAFIKTDGKLLGYKEAFSFVLVQIISCLPGASRMALMMGSGKFLGVEKKHLIRLVFLSFIPVIFIRLGLELDSVVTLYKILYQDVWTVFFLILVCLILLAAAVRIFASSGFYKFYYYLAGLGLWTILDVFFSKRGL